MENRRSVECRRARDARPYAFRRLRERLPPPARTPSTAAAVPLPRGGRSGGLRRSRPTALPSIGYRGFAVAPMTLRAPFRRVVITSGKRARNARPYGGRRCNQRLQIHLTVAMMQPSVAYTSHSCNFPQRCRGAHRAPADILPTIDFPSPDLPPRGRGTARRRWKEFDPVAFTLNIFFFRHTHRTHEAHEAYEAYEEDFSERRRFFLGILELQL